MDLGGKKGVRVQRAWIIHHGALSIGQATTNAIEPLVILVSITQPKRRKETVKNACNPLIQLYFSHSDLMKMLLIDVLEIF